MRWLNFVLPALAACGLSACTTMQPQDFAGGSPTMALNDFSLAIPPPMASSSIVLAMCGTNSTSIAMAVGTARP